MALSLSNRQLAELYEGLYRLYDAGLAPSRIFSALDVEASANMQQALKRANALTASGQSFASALRQAGLSNPRDDLLIHHAERTGGLAAVLDALSEHYRHRAQRRSKVQAQLMYPLTILVLAVFIAPITALFVGDLTLGGYALRTVVPLATVALGYSLIVFISRRRGGGAMSVFFLELAHVLPVVGGLVARRTQVDFLTCVALFLQRGLPASDAMSSALGGVRVRKLRLRCEAAQSALDDGLGVAGVLSKAGIIDAQGFAIVHTAEAAGQLDSTLTRYAHRMSEEFEETLDTYATWSSRVVYLFVLIILGAGIVG